MMKSNITFWQFISKNKIEIPIIQRDYAQGREEDKVNTIREEFVSELIEQIKNTENSEFHLGFVYGKLEGKNKEVTIKKNKDAIENILNAVQGYANHLELNFKFELDNKSSIKNDLLTPTLIPLDGQQRLTTLFLLHWYTLQFVDVETYKKQIAILNRFSYKTRKSALAFCKEITKEKSLITQINSNLSKDEVPIKPDVYLSENKVSEVIKNSTWFLNVWLKDATVQGMLVMLDEIQTQLNGFTNKELLFDKLVNSNIVFDFLDLDEINQTDELYVKMNARGKQLTEFEHFKAWLQKYIIENKIELKEAEWKTKLDKDWLDLFWKQNPKHYNVDNLIYNFYKQVGLILNIANEKSINDNLIKGIREEKYISFKTFEKNSFYNSKSLNTLFTTLDNLNNYEQIKKYLEWSSDIVLPFIKNKINHFFLTKDLNKVEMPSTVFYYAFIIFINDNQINSNELQFKRWMRVCRNLIYNTYIQTPENFKDAIKSITKMAEYKSDIFSHIQNDKIDFFNKQQEKVKSKLIEQSEGWEYAIKKLENHIYFQGDISFILNNIKKDTVYNLEKFNEYSKIISVLYSSKIRNHSNKILERALLTQGDYLPKVGSNHTFCLPTSGSLRARRDNWQRFFNSNKINILFELVKRLKDPLTVEKDLIEIIKNSDITDWRKYIINCPKTIINCHQGFIRYVDDDTIFLLEKERVYGKKRELKSYNFYINKNIENMDVAPFTKTYYWKNRMSQYKHSCIRVENWKKDGFNYKLELSYNIGKYKLEFLDKDNKELSNKEIIDVLTSREWKLINNIFYKEFSNQDEIDNELKLIIAIFKKLEL